MFLPNHLHLSTTVVKVNQSHLSTVVTTKINLPSQVLLAFYYTILKHLIRQGGKKVEVLKKYYENTRTSN